MADGPVAAKQITSSRDYQALKGSGAAIIGGTQQMNHGLSHRNFRSIPKNRRGEEDEWGALIQL